MVTFAHKTGYLALVISSLLFTTPSLVSAAGEGMVQGTTQKVDLLTGKVTLNHMAADSIDSSKVKNGSLQGGDLAANTLTSTQIGTNAIGADELGNASVDNAALQEGAVTNNKIANGTIQGGKIAANTIQNSNIALGTLSLDRFNQATQAIILGTKTTAALFQTTAITGSDIADGSIGVNHLNSSLRSQIERIDGLDKRLDTHERGIAISMASSNIPTIPNKPHQFGVGVASFGDTQALSARYQAQVGKNAAISFGGGVAGNTSAVNMGLGFGW
ncbi:YadA C-terminal domain-containing protein [Thiofilum flexile]|uniref:YadA C-terminal domain-containing protein n=1 Tax=Thiofilum flexile TaxID=125627 RepID=UPI00037E5D36|nr:YadA C-terminal domain-containing protein [Thiofilum flexile]